MFESEFSFERQQKPSEAKKQISRFLCLCQKEDRNISDRKLPNLNVKHKSYLK